MNIATYLRRTIGDLREPDLTNEQPLLEWMSGSLEALDVAPIEVVPADTADISHKYVRLLGRHYVVWDVALNQALWQFLVGMQYERLANSADNVGDRLRFRDVASSVFRDTLFNYLARKLAKFPHTASAFADLGGQEPATKRPQDIPEVDLIIELTMMQRLLMFYHEVSHAVLAEREELRARSMSSLTQFFDRLGPMVAEQALAADFDRMFPEFTKLQRDERFMHFAEELNCDLQAFMFASMAIPAAPGMPRRAWQDSIGLLIGASEVLSISERVLKLSVSKWTEFARESSDGRELTASSIDLKQYVSDRPLFHMRRWNTATAVAQVLHRIGRDRGEDAFAWAEYVGAKTRGVVEAAEECT